MHSAMCTVCRRDMRSIYVQSGKVQSAQQVWKEIRRPAQESRHRSHRFSVSRPTKQIPLPPKVRISRPVYIKLHRCCKVLLFTCLIYFVHISSLRFCLAAAPTTIHRNGRSGANTAQAIRSVPLPLYKFPTDIQSRLPGVTTGRNSISVSKSTAHPVHAVSAAIGSKVTDNPVCQAFGIGSNILPP